MDATPRLEVHAVMRVQRGTAEACACGGQLAWAMELGCWRCLTCGREYE